MEEQTIKSFLGQISGIIKKYNKIAQITGENFNIFKILNMQYNERYLHSKLIAELLNPNGCHGQSGLFLKLFLNHLNKEIPELKGKIEKLKIDSTHAKINIEVFADWINEEHDKGGYVDIVIEQDGKAILIENKINAGDQYKQLLRYYNFGIDEYREEGNFILLYLTLDGHNPTDQSIGKDENDQDKIALEKFKNYHLVSYKTHIKEWLEECKKESVNHPLLRETITQYINLIKLLTGQTINTDMGKEIIEVIIDDENNVEAAFNIYQSLENIKKSLVEKLFKRIKEIIVPELNQNYGSEEIKFDDSSFGKDEIEIYIQINKMKDFVIGFGCNTIYNGWYYGLKRKKTNIGLSKIDVENRTPKLADLNNANPDELWPRASWFDSYNNWDKDIEVWKMIANNKMEKYFKNKIEEIIEKLEGVNGL